MKSFLHSSFAILGDVFFAIPKYNSAELSSRASIR